MTVPRKLFMLAASLGGAISRLPLLPENIRFKEADKQEQKTVKRAKVKAARKQRQRK